MDIWPGSHVQHVKPKQQTNKCQCQCQCQLRKFDGRDRLDDLSVDSIIFKRDVKDLGVKVRAVLSDSEHAPLVGFCEHGDDLLGFIKAWDFLIGRATINFWRHILYHGDVRFEFCTAPPSVLHPEDRGDTFLRNVGNHLQGHTASHPIISQSPIFVCAYSILDF
jgi:hypothetical protein